MAVAPGFEARPSVVASALKFIHQLVMTPVVFVTFLLSLALVNYYYDIMRIHIHSNEHNSVIPWWLHHILYRPVPYSSKATGAPGNPKRNYNRDTDKSSSGSSWWFYRTKQKKLMRMEVADAFQIRNRVLLMLVILAAVTIWAIWLAVRFVLVTLCMLLQHL